MCNPTVENAKALDLADRTSLLLTGMGNRFTVFTRNWPTVWEQFSEVWLYGGDGTLNWFINLNPHIELPIAVFPGGSGNDFHWMLYGAIGLEEQVDLVLRATAKKVDAGICNEKLFLNGLGIGFDGAIVHDLLGKKKVAGKASYLLSILKHIFGYHEKSFHIRTESNDLKKDCFLLSVANARRYGGGFQVAPKAKVDDGLLDLNIVGRISPFSRVRYLPVVEKGEHLDLPFVDYYQIRKVLITCDEKAHAHVDGEYFFENRFEVEVLPERFSFLY